MTTPSLTKAERVGAGAGVLTLAVAGTLIVQKLFSTAPCNASTSDSLFAYGSPLALLTAALIACITKRLRRPLLLVAVVELIGFGSVFVHTAAQCGG